VDGFYLCPVGGCSGTATSITDFYSLYPYPGIGASAGNFFFWDGSSGLLNVCAEQGCASTTAISNTGPGYGRLVTNANAVFWCGAGVLTCSTTGTCNPTVVHPNCGGPPGVAIDGNDLYWAESSDHGGDGLLHVSNLDGSNDTPLAAPGASGPVVAAGGQAFFWSLGGDLMTVSRAHPTPTVYAAGIGYPNGQGFNDPLVASDGTYLYFLAPRVPNAELAKCASGPTCAAPTTTLPASGAVLGGSLEVDDTNVYWLENENLVKFHK
jgi:hypothetical protein